MSRPNWRGGYHRLTVGALHAGEASRPIKATLERRVQEASCIATCLIAPRAV
jgi:hypothetical protein